MSEPTTSGTSAGTQSESTQPPAAKPASVWEDFIDIFYAPSEVYERRAQSGFFLPLFVVTVLVGILFVVNSGVLAPIMDAEMSRSFAAMQKKGATLTAAQMEGARKMAETVGKVAAFIFMPVGIFFTGLFLWIVGKFVESKATFGQGLMVAAYAFVPRIVEAVLASVQGLLLDPSKLTGRYKLSLGLGRFFDPDTASPMLLALIGRIDVFTIWVTVLLAIGLSVVGKITRRQGAIAAVIVWFIGALPNVLQAARQ
ncbi:MAG: Yip1 family protein [bacterium]